MFIPGSTPTNINLPITTSAMNNNFQQQQQSFFDNLKDSRSNKLSSSMSRKAPTNPNFSLDPDLLRELNARYLHDINAPRPTNGTNPNFDSNAFSTLLLPPFLRAEHYHQHTHTHEHNLNIFTPPSNPSFHANLNNSLIDKLSKSDNSFSSVLRTAAVNNFSSPSLLAPPGLPPIFPPFNLINSTSSSPLTTTATTTTTMTTTTTNTTPSSTITPPVNHSQHNSTKRNSSPQAKKSGKWCAAHVRISWMIYHQQQRSKDKLSPTVNKKDNDEEQKQQSSSSLLNNKLSDSVSASKPSLQSTLPSSSTTNDLSLSLPAVYQPPILPPPAFNFRSPFEFAAASNGPFGRVLPSSNTAFGGLGTLFPPPPPTSSSTLIDRKPDMNGSLAAASALALDWSRLHRSMGTPFIPPLPLISANNENGSLKKLDETHNSNNEKKRSSTVLNNDDDRRNSHYHLMLPPTHLSNSTHTSSHRSRSPHRSLHSNSNHSSSSLLHKNSSSSSTPPPQSSSIRKRTSPTVKSSSTDSLKSSSHSSTSGSLSSVVHPSMFPVLDPLTLSMMERQRLSAAYASLFGVPPGTNNFFPPNFDPSTLRANGSSSLFPNIENSSAMTAALIQREHFLNSLRLSQQQQHEQSFERERVTATPISQNGSSSSLTRTSKTIIAKTEQTSPKTTEETTRISPKVLTSPGSHSSSSSSSRSSSSKKSSHVKRVKQSSSPSSLTISIEHDVTNLKQESTIESTPTISITS